MSIFDKKPDFFANNPNLYGPIEKHHPGRQDGPTEPLPQMVHQDWIHGGERDAVEKILKEDNLKKSDGSNFSPGNWSLRKESSFVKGSQARKENEDK